jgi:O-antigen ligase
MNARPSGSERGDSHLILAAAATILPATLMLAMVFVTDERENVVLLGVAAGGLLLVTQLRRYIDWVGLLIAAVVLTSSVSAQYWLDHRLIIATFPLSVLDVTAALFGLCGFVKWVRSPQVRLDATGWLVLLWLVYNSLVAATFGLAAGNSAFAVAQEYRLVAYAATGYFATLMLFEAKAHLGAMLVSTVGAGIIVSIWQLVITVSGRDMAPTEMIALIPGGVSRALRDTNLPLYFAGSALVTLIVTQLEVPSLWRRARVVPWLVPPIFCVAMLLSMTRTVWVSLLASAALLLVYAVVASRYRARNMLQAVVFVGVLGSTLAIARVMGRAILPSVYESLEKTWSYSFSASDTTYFDRISGTSAVLEYLGNRAGTILIGMGFGNMWSGTVREGPFVDVHNAYLAYWVIGGLVGLALFLAVWCAQAIIYWRLLRRDLDGMTKAYTVASLINWTVMSLLLTSMPPHWTESLLLGVTIAIASKLHHQFAGAPMAGAFKPRSFRTQPELRPGPSVVALR